MSENGATDAFAGPAAARLAVEASSTPARRAFQPERLAQLPKFGRAAVRNNSAATTQKKAQTHDRAAAPSDRQLLSSPRLLAVAAPSSSPDHSSKQRAAARAANPKNAASLVPELAILAEWGSSDLMRDDCPGLLASL